MNKIRLFLVLTLLLVSCTSNLRQENNAAQNHITIVGIMRNVMMKGELSGIIALDTISNKKNLFGLGPVENLAGEILILDGTSYLSTVETDSSMRIAQSYQAKAPFFAYANIAEWKEVNLPDTIQTLQQVETYLHQTTRQTEPFFFRLEGEVDKAIIHVVNLPPGSLISSPDEAHVGQRNYTLENEAVEILGFFSTKHKAIFTHHNTFLHLHLISADKKWMGHVDYLRIDPRRIKLLLSL